jgi:hypothetical protein
MNRLLSAIVLGLLFASDSLSGDGPLDHGEPSLSTADYSFAYWVNGWRRESKKDENPDILCIETSRFAFALDVADFAKSWFLERKEHSHSSSAASPRTPKKALPPEEPLKKNSASSSPLIPLKVTLQVPVQVPVMWNGKEVGKMNLPAGKTVRVESDWGTKLNVFAGNRKISIPKADTNFSDLQWEMLKNARTKETKSEDENKNAANFEGETTRGLEGGQAKDKQESTFSQDTLGYLGGVQEGVKLFEQMKSAEFRLEIDFKGKKYRATSCAAGRDEGTGRLHSAELFESGRFVNHYLLKDLEFRAEDGDLFPAEADLQFVSWPGSMAFTLYLTPKESLESLALSLKFSASDKEWIRDYLVDEFWEEYETREFSLRCGVTGESLSAKGVSLMVDSGNDAARATFIDAWDGFVFEVPARGLARGFGAGVRGYTDIRDYDEFTVSIQNDENDAVTVPFLLDQRDVANITGLCPILCDEEGNPTGIPLQLSKNWHHQEKSMRSYQRTFALLPAKSGKTVYKLRVVYGFYGSLPSASHAQLCLVGYTMGRPKGNGRWDQLAIGCWGETQCFDVDMSLTSQMVTDSRLLMVRNGGEGKMWGWTDAGWGGDWLGVADENGRELHFTGMKTAYQSHGPCLTEAVYKGHYGVDRQVDVGAVVRTLRTDDYVRTFHDLDYTFKAQLPLLASKKIAKGYSWLFKMGDSHGYVIPHIVLGNRDGVLKELEMDPDSTLQDVVLDKFVLEGQGPWWIAFPGSRHAGPVDDDPEDDGKPSDYSGGKASGSKALVIRSYKSTFGGKSSENPTVSIYTSLRKKAGEPNATVFLDFPEGVEGSSPGDSVSMKLEWVGLPCEAEDYYGPNDFFRAHMVENPRSWKTVHREAVGNDLQIAVEGGDLLRNYPIFIKVDPTASAVRVVIKGGVGAVPVRFEGLPSAGGYLLERLENGRSNPLDQSVHGNDFWQTDWDPSRNTYSQTYNLPLDGSPESTWVLRRVVRR